MHEKPHRPGSVWWLALLATAGITLAACSDDSGEAAEKDAPASIEEVAEGEIGRITLTDQAAKRLDIQTATVDEGSETALQVPSSAIIYQPDGTTWVYTNPEGLVYHRQPIEIDRIDGDLALLTSGPEAGTPVVVVGASELWGFEFGVGK